MPDQEQLEALASTGTIVRIGDRVWERKPVYGLSREEHYARLDMLGVRDPLSNELFGDRQRLLSVGVEDIFRYGGERLGELAMVEPRRHASGFQVTYFTSVRPHFDEGSGIWRADVTGDLKKSRYTLHFAVNDWNAPIKLSTRFLRNRWASAVKNAAGIWLQPGSWPVARGVNYYGLNWSLVADDGSVDGGSRWVGDAKNFNKELLAKIPRLA